MKTTKLLTLFAALLLTSAEFIAIDHLFTHPPGHVAADWPSVGR